MEFPNTIKVKGKVLDPLSEDIQLSPRLELTLADLRKVERDIQERYKDHLTDERAVITTDDRPGHLNLFEIFNSHGRATYSRERKYDEQVRFEEVFATKGSGNLGWLREKAPSAKNEQGLERKYPIVIKKYGLNTPKVWGGESIEFAKKQYVNALILNALIQRHGTPQATYFPLRIVGLEEIPITEDGKLRVCSLEEYCDDSFSFDERTSQYVKIPSLKRSKDFVQLHYVGDTVDVRVPCRTTKDEWGQRYYSAGVLRELFDDTKATDSVIDFARKVGSLVRVVHSYGGSFTFKGKNNRFLSSLDQNNVSLGGNVCDLDTLSFEVGESLQELQERERLVGTRTSNFYAELFEETRQVFGDEEKRKLPAGSYEINYGSYAIRNLKAHAENAFKEAYNSN